ncbi:MAG: prepilin-type N-terminal cleavage/methylation domain-containing protein [Bacilli bacterium]|nr:prepilin-type N-terminal cleavage/methylation domain-containing protein [Bacilli bacterium]
MNKKGFTLVEILAVIVIIALLSVLAIAGATGISNRIKKKNYDTKVETLKTAALDYAESYYNEIKNSGEKCVSIEDLIVGGYIKADNDHITKIPNYQNICMNGDKYTAKCSVADPTDDTKYMYGVVVKYENKQLKAVYNGSC